MGILVHLGKENCGDVNSYAFKKTLCNVTEHMRVRGTDSPSLLIR